ncbi:phage head closure protein [Halalkalibacter oceani]|uniref:phage head closure protein n=1 Tax=Halalkalibacter oceani TaxID=1653776 RepID=UPI003390B66E
MNPGDLRQRLIFQIPSGAKDADGFPIREPQEYTKAWAELKTLKGRTFYTAAQNNMQHNREFTIRYQSKLADGARPKNLQVIWQGVAHTIESIEDDDGLKKSMTVIAKAVN